MGIFGRNNDDNELGKRAAKHIKVENSKGGRSFIGQKARFALDEQSRLARSRGRTGGSTNRSGSSSRNQRNNRREW